VKRRAALDKDYAEFGANYCKAATFAESLGIRLAFHPHRSCLVETSAEVARLETFVPELNLHVDTGHLFCVGEDPLDLIASRPGRTLQVALKDWNPSDESFAGLGTGEQRTDFFRTMIPGRRMNPSGSRVTHPGGKAMRSSPVLIAVRTQGLRIFDQNHIEVSGLTFSRFNVPYRPQNPNLPGWEAYDHLTQLDLETFAEPSAIMLGGNTSNIRVANNRFYHVPAVVKGMPWRAPNIAANQVFPNLSGGEFDSFGEFEISAR